MACALCLKPVPTGNRRKLYGMSSGLCLQSFREVALSVGLEGIIPEENVNDAFTCVQCFRTLEKYAKVKASLNELKTTLTKKVECTAMAHNITPVTQEEEAINCPSLASRKRNTVVANSELETSPRPSKRRKIQRTPTRQVQRRTPNKQKKRMKVNTPIHNVLDMPAESSPAIAVVERRHCGSKHSISYLSKSLTKIGRSVGRKNHSAIARQVVAHTKVRKAIIKTLGKLIRKEMKMLSRKSVLHGLEHDALLSFTWQKLSTDLESTAPNFVNILKEFTVRKKRKISKKKLTKQGKSYAINDMAVVGMCAAILLRHQSQRMNLVQRLISVLLYCGHAPKKLYTRLQRLLLCLSHKSTIRTIDKLGEGHDQAVLGWRDTIQLLMDDNDAHTATLQQTETTEAVTPQISTETIDTTVGDTLSSSDDSSELTVDTCSLSSSCVSSPLYSSLSDLESSSESNSPSQTEYIKPTSQLPAFKIVGDNIDKYVKPREMRIDAQAKSLNYFNSYAIKGRIDVAKLEDLPCRPDFRSFEGVKLLPTKKDLEAIESNFVILIQRVLKKHFPFFKRFCSKLGKHIKHQYYNEMTQKSEVIPLGIIPKCETKHDDMIEIMDQLQDYVPTYTEEVNMSIPSIGEKVAHADYFHHILFGGDMLTAKRARGSQHIRSNSLRGKKQLLGLQPVVEDWHCKVCLLKAIWKRLYKCASKRDEGTLYQLRCLINRRNVVSNPEKSVTACEEFFLLVVEAHICALAMEVFKLDSLDSTPSYSSLFPEKSSELSPARRLHIADLAVKKLVRKYIDISYPTASTPKDVDHVRAYAKEVVSLGLLLMEFIDSIREGDGERIVRCWRFFLPLFKVTGRKNYSIEAFNLLFNLEYAFTPRMKKQLMWERTVNVHGRPGMNVSMDLHMEHINRACKAQMGMLGPNTTDQSIDRIGKSIGSTFKIGGSFDQVNSVRIDSGYHSKRAVKLDMDKVVMQLQKKKVFKQVPQRKHAHFPVIEANSTRQLPYKELKEWMESKVKQREIFYV